MYFIVIFHIIITMFVTLMHVAAPKNDGSIVVVSTDKFVETNNFPVNGTGWIKSAVR